MRKLWIVFSLFFLVALANAGTTAVTATITDPSGQVFANGTVRADFVPTPGVPGPFTVNGVPFTQSVSGTLNASGLFTMTLTDNLTVNPSGSLWAFTINSNTSAPAFTATVLVTGATQNLSATLSASARLIRIFTAPTVNRAYSDTEVTGGTGSIYWNVLTSALKCYNGSTWIGCQSNGIFSDIITAGPWLDVRSITGVDCTGATDSAPALNALTLVAGNISGKNVSFPPNCIIKLGSTWLIKNQYGYKLSGWAPGGVGTLATFNWCGNATDPMINKEYDSYFNVEYLSFNNWGNGCPYASPVAINYDKTGGGGIENSTDAIFNRLAFHNDEFGQLPIPASFIGIQLSTVSTSNVENVRILYSNFFCGVNTSPYDGIVIGASPNTKSEIITHNNFNNCRYGIWQKGGSSRIQDNEFGQSLLDIRMDGWTDSELIENNVSEASSQFIDTNVGSTGGQLPITLIGNHFDCAVGYADPTKAFLSFGGSGTPSVNLIGNSFDRVPGCYALDGGTSVSFNSIGNAWPSNDTDKVRFGNSPGGFTRSGDTYGNGTPSPNQPGFIYPTTLTDSAAVTWDVVANNNVSITLNHTIATRPITITYPHEPNGIFPGTTGRIMFIQDGTGGATATIAGCTPKVSGGGGTLPITTTASAVDIFTFNYDSTTGNCYFSTEFTTAGAGAGTVTNAAALTANAVVIGGGGAAVSTIGVSSTTNQALYATAGAPAFRQPVAADIATGALANGMTATTQSAADGSTKLATDAYADASAHTMAGAGTKTCTNQAVTVLTTNANSAPTGTCSTITSAYVDSTVTITVASGAKALATGAISSATCTSAQTSSATGTLTTDTIVATFNGDPTAVTGYVPLTTGMLTIIPYPTADTVNFKVCNNTGASITPGAITINWKVVR